jgi:pimeloyl-ACP methyl ester carboxylesterase
VHLLREQGYDARNPDLPGNEATTRIDFKEVTLERYVERIAREVDETPGPVILVGHSMGGIVLSGVAEARPERILASVYVSAFILPNGACVDEFSKELQGSAVAAARQPDPSGTFSTLKPDGARAALYHLSPEHDAADAVSRLVPQGILPAHARLQLSEARYGSVPRVFIECTEDRAIPLDFQRKMARSARCKPVFSLRADHSPFFSATEELVAILVQIAADQ